MAKYSSEEKLSALSRQWLWIGRLGAAIFVVAFFWTEDGDINALVFAGAAVASLLQGGLLSALLHGAADVVRLLKKQNGVEYDGEI